jgi:hypothetical protein
VNSCTAIYRSLMLELERRRVALGWSMEKFNEYAGLPDGYYNKAVSMDAPSGKQAQWSTVQLMVDALFYSGFDLEIRPKPGAVMSEDNLKAKLLQLRPPGRVFSQRQLMSELGKKGAKKGVAARMAKVGKRRRKQIAKHAAVIRWELVKAAVAGKPPWVKDKCDDPQKCLPAREHKANLPTPANRVPHTSAKATAPRQESPLGQKRSAGSGDGKSQGSRRSRLNVV